MRKTAEERAALIDIRKKVKGMLRECLKQVDARVAHLQASGADPAGDHIAHESNFEVPKCILVALLNEWASPRGFGPSRRVMVSQQDRAWLKRIRNYEAML